MGSAKKTGSSSRQDHIARVREAERSRQRRGRAVALVAVAVVVVAGAGAGAWALTRDSGSTDTGAKKGEAKSGEAKSGKAKGAPEFTVGKDGVKSWNPDDLDRHHVTTSVHYPMTPPVGGDHNPVWMNCNGDVYKKAIPDENAVHSLEHGAVWVTYTGKAAAADVRKLADKVAKTPYSLMSPLDGQQDPIMLTAWGKQRTVKSADDPAVDTFFSAYVQGPQTPEPGAACTGGVAK